jgi:hypothetical protein
MNPRPAPKFALFASAQPGTGQGDIKIARSVPIRVRNTSRQVQAPLLGSV